MKVSSTYSIFYLKNKQLLTEKLKIKIQNLKFKTEIWQSGEVVTR